MGAKNCLELSFFQLRVMQRKKIDFAWVEFWAVGLFLGLVLAYGFYWGYNHLSLFAYPRHLYTIIHEHQPPPPPPPTHTHTHTCSTDQTPKTLTQKNVTLNIKTNVSLNAFSFKYNKGKIG